MGFLSDLTGGGGRRRAYQAAAEAQGYIRPYQEAGTAALSQMQNFDPSSVAMDPEYQFQLQQGQQGIESGAAARGGLLSGANLASLAQYGQGLATNYAGRKYQRLADMANLGYGAGVNLGNIAQNRATAANQATAAGVSNTLGLIQQGTALAAAPFTGGMSLAGAAPVTGGLSPTSPGALNSIGQGGGFGQYNPNTMYIG